MNKTILLSIVSVVVVGGLIYFGFNSKKSTEIVENTNTNEACVGLCNNTKSTCPSLMANSNCESSCNNWDDTVKEKVANASNCEALSAIPEVLATLIPEMNTPDVKEASNGNDCEMACSNYSVKCLSLVPNASQELYNEGLMSCINECKKWDDNKTSCILNAIDCESMTNVCGL